MRSLWRSMQSNSVLLVLWESGRRWHLVVLNHCAVDPLDVDSRTILEHQVLGSYQSRWGGELASSASFTLAYELAAMARIFV